MAAKMTISVHCLSADPPKWGPWRPQR